MSAPSVRLPRTTGWGLVLAAVVGTLALAAVEPAVVLGAFCGLALATVVSKLGGSAGRVTAASALVPLITFVAAVAVGTTGSMIAGALTAVGVVLGLATRFVLADDVPAVAIERASTVALFGGFGAGTIAVLAFGVSAAGGWKSAIAATLWVTGGGPIGFALAVAVCALAVGAALFALPPAAFTTPAGRNEYVKRRRGLFALLVIGVVLVGLVLSAFAIVSSVVTPLGDLLTPLVDSSLLRGAVMLVTVGGAVLAAFGLAVRFSWHGTERRENAIVPILIGASTGTILPIAIVLPVTEDGTGAVGASFGATALVLVTVSLLSWGRGAKLGTVIGLASASAIAVALALGGVVIGASTADGAGLETIWTGALSFVVLATALFAYDAGRYGRTLAREVGREGAAREPQLVRMGWSALVAGIGVPVALVGLGVATLFAPILSAPATAALAVALTAVVAGTWVVFR